LSFQNSTDQKKAKCKGELADMNLLVRYKSKPFPGQITYCCLELVELKLLVILQHAGFGLAFESSDIIILAILFRTSSELGKHKQTIVTHSSVCIEQTKLPAKLLDIFL